MLDKKDLKLPMEKRLLINSLCRVTAVELTPHERMAQAR